MREKPLVYFVDDEPELLALYSMAVENDFRYKTFEDPEHLFQEVQSGQFPGPDILVSDLKMPNMTGLDLAVKLRDETDLSCPFILLSGNLSKSDLLVAVNNGVERVLEKPCDMNDLIQGISEVYYATEIRTVRGDIRNVANKIVELSAALEQMADFELPNLKKLLDDPSFEKEDGQPLTFREEMVRLHEHMKNLIEQERIIERLQKVA